VQVVLEEDEDVQAKDDRRESRTGGPWLSVGASIAALRQLVGHIVETVVVPDEQRLEREAASGSPTEQAEEEEDAAVGTAEASSDDDDAAAEQAEKAEKGRARVAPLAGCGADCPAWHRCRRRLLLVVPLRFSRRLLVLLADMFMDHGFGEVALLAEPLAVSIGAHCPSCITVDVGATGTRVAVIEEGLVKDLAVRWTRVGMTAVEGALAGCIGEDGMAAFQARERAVGYGGHDWCFSTAERLVRRHAHLSLSPPYPKTLNATAAAAAPLVLSMPQCAEPAASTCTCREGQAGVPDLDADPADIWGWERPPASAGSRATGSVSTASLQGQENSAAKEGPQQQQAEAAAGTATGQEATDGGAEQDGGVGGGAASSAAAAAATEVRRKRRRNTKPLVPACCSLSSCVIGAATAAARDAAVPRLLTRIILTGGGSSLVGVTPYLEAELCNNPSLPVNTVHILGKGGVGAAVSWRGGREATELASVWQCAVSRREWKGGQGTRLLRERSSFRWR